MPDLKQVTKDFVNPISWLRLLIGVLILFGAYKFITRPTQAVRVGQGGVANIYNQTKRTFIPFIEVYTGKEKNYSDLNYGIRGGVRFEF